VTEMGMGFLMPSPSSTNQSYLEFTQPIPQSRLSDEPSENNSKAEDAALCGHASQRLVEALGSPDMGEYGLIKVAVA